jgi:acetyl esterase
MEWFIKNTIAKPADKEDPRLDLVGRANLKGLPDATVITDDIDPLMSEGKALAEKLKAAGSHVMYQNYDGVTHEFFGMNAVVKEAEAAQTLAAKDLKAAFTQKAHAKP